MARPESAKGVAFELLNEANIGRAIWDWKAGFKYWDDKQGRPVPAMHEAMFGQTEK